MPDYPQMTIQQRASQTMAQTQSQKMSQTQIMSLNLLAMSSTDLRSEIYAQAAKNPALEIKSDSLESGVSSSRSETAPSSRFSDNTHYGSASAGGEQASNNFQAALESNPDEREVLSDHLLHQLNAMHLSGEEKLLCTKLIYNLDEKGFHILAPVTFLNTKNSFHTEDFLNKCLCLVQHLDPVGCCTNNYRESLFVQAKISGSASDLALFFLKTNEHFDFLNPPQIPKIQKKLSDYLSEQKKLKFISEDEITLSKDNITAEEIEKALSFIKTLDPFPARNFGSSQTTFISPDVIVTKNENTEELSQKNQNGKTNETAEFTVTFAREFLPRLEISKDYTNLINETHIKTGDTSEKAERKKAELKFARSSVNEAKVFIESILYRESTILKAAQEIVKAQTGFFKKGARYLAPLRQKDIAEKLGVHEATVSRMANSKYLACEWGIFPISYFFTNAVGNKDKPLSDSSESTVVSKEGVKAEIARILEEHKNDKKALSDQKISDILAEKGIKIARRTVAKYRGELNINSSYER
ncbi:RNA polymerase factor sigma-54 [Treponema sp.]|uniref:RNA polymerase factor sigma-54 n=1 Tax=Treponema sp. TaxID=166 RepID=UPI00388D4EB5